MVCAEQDTSTAGLEKPAHMSDELFEVWRKIAPGPDYAPLRIASAEARARSAESRATAAEARVDRLAGALEEITDLGSDGEHSGDRHARCRSIARAALQQEPTT